MVMPSAYIPDRGDAVWITLDPQAGHEQAGRRPALVLSPMAYNGRVGLALMCPITNRQKGYPFEVPLPVSAGVTSVVLSDQVKCLDWRARQIEFISRLPETVLSQVWERLAPLLPSE